MYSVCHNYLFILSFQMLAASFGLTGPSSVQYLKKIYICRFIYYNSSISWDPTDSHYCSLQLIPATVVLSVVSLEFHVTSTVHVLLWYWLTGHLTVKL